MPGKIQRDEKELARMDMFAEKDSAVPSLFSRQTFATVNVQTDQHLVVHINSDGSSWGEVVPDVEGEE